MTSLSLPKRSDVNFREVSASCLHSGFWHFIDKVKAEGMTGEIRGGGLENRAAQTHNISTVSLRHIYVMLITPLF